MPIIVTETEFQKFRGELHNQFKNLADSTMDLLDALCSNNKTASVVQLSLNPLFRRGYCALFKAIGALSFSEISKAENGEGEHIQPQEWEEKPLVELIAEVVPKPEERPFFLLGLHEHRAPICQNIGGSRDGISTDADQRKQTDNNWSQLFDVGGDTRT